MQGDMPISRLISVPAARLAVQLPHTILLWVPVVQVATAAAKRGAQTSGAQAQAQAQARASPMQGDIPVSIRVSVSTTAVAVQLPHAALWMPVQAGTDAATGTNAATGTDAT